MKSISFAFCIFKLFISSLILVSCISSRIPAGMPQRGPSDDAYIDYLLRKSRYTEEGNQTMALLPYVVSNLQDNGWQPLAGQPYLISFNPEQGPNIIPVDDLNTVVAQYRLRNATAQSPWVLILAHYDDSVTVASLLTWLQQFTLKSKEAWQLLVVLLPQASWQYHMNVNPPEVISNLLPSCQLLLQWSHLSAATRLLDIATSTTSSSDAFNRWQNKLRAWPWPFKLQSLPTMTSASRHCLKQTNMQWQSPSFNQGLNRDDVLQVIAWLDFAMEITKK